MNALILEEDPIVAQDIENKILKNKLASNVVKCCSSYEAIRFLENLEISISFLDVKIGESPVGIELGHYLRKHTCSAIVYITGHYDDETINSLSAIRPDGFLLKPFEERQFVAIAKHAINKYQVLQPYGHIKLQFSDGMLTDSKIQLFQEALNDFYLVSITDKTGKIIFANELFCLTSGYSSEELIGNNHRVINSGVHNKDFFKAMWTDILSGKSWRGEVCNKKKNGQLYWVDSIIFPLLDSNFDIYFMSLRSDITERKKLEKNYKDLLEVKAVELMESQQFLTDLFKTEQINQFAATLSHEIKRPLSSIILQLDCVLKDHPDLREEIKGKLLRLQLSSRRTLDLANYINNIFKKSDDKTNSIVLAQFIEKIIEFSRLVFHYEEVEFTFEAKNELSIIFSEEILFVSLFNLIKNSVEAFKEEQKDRKVQVVIVENLKVLQIDVKDNAGGVPKDIVSELFLNKIKSSKLGGSGLGLSITRSLLKSLGAEIHLFDNSNYGATFRITVPKRVT